MVGTRHDSVGKSIRVVIDNLRRDRGFLPLDADLIDEYRGTLSGRQRQRRPRRAGTWHGRLPQLLSMPVYVSNSHFSPSEERKITAAHPAWENFVDWIPRLRLLDRGQHFLAIDFTTRQRTFTVSRYLEHDRVRGVGVVAHVRDGKDRSLAKLAERLGVSQGSLLTSKKLDIYGIAILRRGFSAAFA